jgi:hypothetical protein
VVHDSIATLVHGRILLVSGTDEGRTASFDGRTDSWRREPSMAGMYSGDGCPYLAATVAGQAVVMPCEGDAPAVLDSAGWVPTGRPPFPTPCCDVAWLDAGGALVVIRAVGGSDGRVAPPPDARAAVWVPPDD